MKEASRGGGTPRPPSIPLALALALAIAGCGSEEVALPELEPLRAEAADGAENRPPRIVGVRFDPAQPARGDRLRAQATTRDPEGDPVELDYRWTVDGVEQPGRDAEIELLDASSGARIEVVVTASDGKASSEPFRARARVVDRPPRITGVGIQPTDRVAPGETVTVTPMASDPDGDPVTFELQWLVNDREVDAEGDTFSTDGLRRGDRIRARVVARDGSNRSRPFETLDVVVGSAHPVITSTPPGLTDAGVFRYRVEAHDPDGDRALRYRLTQAPPGMTIDGVRGEIVWRPGAGDAGVHTVGAAVRDSTGLETTQTFEVTVATDAAGAPAAASP